MEIKFLKYFIEIAKWQSMRKAAANLYVTQPNLTRAMQSLEDEIGAPLFIRSNRGVKLTTIGESLFYYAQSIVKQLDEIESLKYTSRQQMPHKLSISFGNLFLSDDILLYYYQQIQTNHANITILETSTEEVLNNISTLKSEIGFVTVNDLQLPALKKILELKDLELHEISEGPLYVHVGRQSPLFGREYIHARHLLPHTYISLPEDFFSNLNQLLDLDGIRIMDFTKTLKINNYHAIINMVKRTDAFIFGNQWQREELQKGQICSILLEKCSVRKKLLWIKRKKEILSFQAESFVNLITSEYGSD